MQQKKKQQEQRLQRNIQQAKRNKADLRAAAAVKPAAKTAPVNSNIVSSIKKKLFGRSDAPRTAQQSIPYREMYKDGICRVTDKLYTKTVTFSDITYQLAQNEDKSAIFEAYCEFLNYFDSSISVQLTFINRRADIREFQQSIDIPEKDDEFADIRREYSDMLKNQLARGNNGLIKTT